MAICSFIISLLIIIIAVYSLKHSKKPEPKKIFGIYNQPGKWYCVKYFLFLLLLEVRRLKYRVFGKSFIHKESKLEKLQPLSSHNLACDAVFFQAVSQDGIYICGGTERRHEAKINGLFYIVVRYLRVQ
ncbi:hypothetical protein NQ318_005208 [Aromia moschata]|uniref:Uncharacterized protein n=1 Tax=Aromia moschata TaxID=1265417 RepID=A0AAV8XKI1_9CUCU|nr:hypothetical protein NQ318_005208 [Aromia moschata]